MDEKRYKVPPRAHFIWAGGKKVMDLEGIELVSSWIKANDKTEGFIANLWVDKLTAEKSLVEVYKELFKAHGITVLDEQEAKITDISKIIPAPLILRDIAANNYRNEYVAYEIDKLRPNFGSSSDLLRYAILLKEPGFYCDCSDVGVGTTKLSSLFSQAFRRHAVFLEHRPQQPLAEQALLERFDIDQLGNDTFAVTAGPDLNPALFEMVKMSRKNYDLSVELSRNHLRVAHSGNNIKDITIRRTGPGLVRQVLEEEMGCKEDAGILVDSKGKVEIHRVRDGVSSLVTPKVNTCNWLSMRITPYRDEPNLAIQAVINTIKFEAKHFKVLRLDDHICDVVASTGGKISSREALAALTPVIKENSGNIKYTQLTGQFAETLDFARGNNLTSIFQVSLEACIVAINEQAYLGGFIDAETKAEKSENV